MQEKSKKIKILFFSIIIGILLLGVIYTYNNIQKSNIYQFKNQTYYEVTLNPNNYFLKDTLESDHYYIANSIKNIDIYFDYYLKDKTKENINYSYNMTATIKSYADNGTKLIWTKDFNLKNINNIDGREIHIIENYKLDYQYYVNYVESFQEYYNIKTESYLSIKLNVQINDKDNPYVELVIPLNENIIEITMKEENAFLENNKQNVDLKIIIVFIILVIATIYLISKILFYRNDEKTILKSYQDIIITIQKKPNINMDNIIYLTSLKDLINIAVNNNSNIFHYQNSYYAIIDNIYYIYHLKKTI